MDSHTVIHVHSCALTGPLEPRKHLHNLDVLQAGYFGASPIIDISIPQDGEDNLAALVSIVLSCRDYPYVVF